MRMFLSQTTSLTFYKSRLTNPLAYGFTINASNCSISCALVLLDPATFGVVMLVFTWSCPVVFVGGGSYGRWFMAVLVSMCEWVVQ
jgi:hypothetical protein